MEIKSSCERFFAPVCEDDTVTTARLMSPDTKTFLNFFVTYVSILSLLNLLSAWSWLARRGERGDGAWIKSGIVTMRTLGLVMGVKKSN